MTITSEAISTSEICTRFPSGTLPLTVGLTREQHDGQSIIRVVVVNIHEHHLAIAGVEAGGTQKTEKCSSGVKCPDF